MIAVLDVEDRRLEPGKADLSNLTTDLLIEELLERGVVRVVERERLGLLLEELKLGVSGLVDAGEAARVGRLLGVDALLFTVLQSASQEDNKRSAGIAYTLKRETRVDMSARLVHVETGEILASAQVSEVVTERKSVAFGFAKSGDMKTPKTAIGAAVEQATRELAWALSIPRKAL